MGDIVFSGSSSGSGSGGNPTDTVGSHTFSAFPDSFTLSVNGISGVAIAATGTWGGSDLDLEMSADGSTFSAPRGEAYSSGNIRVVSSIPAAAQGNFYFPVAGMSTLKISTQSGFTGSVTVTLRATTGEMDNLTALMGSTGTGDISTVHVTNNSLQVDLSQTSANGTAIRVEGQDTPADGFANPANAVPALSLLLGWDAPNTAWRRLQVDTLTGTLKVDPGTVTVTGTITANQGGAPWTFVGNATPGDTVVNPSNAIPSESFLMGWDAGNSVWRRVQVDTATGTLKVDPGTVTVTGTVTVNGTVTSNQGTAAALAGAWPVEVTDGSNILGTAAHPLRIDPTGTTTQPVSGTVTANQGTANATPWNENIAQYGGAATTLGQKASASSIPVVLASDQNNAVEAGGNLAAAKADLDNLSSTTQNTLIQLLSDIRMELRIMNAQHQSAFGLKDELDVFRSDPYYATSGYDNGVN